MNRSNAQTILVSWKAFAARRKNSQIVRIQVYEEHSRRVLFRCLTKWILLRKLREQVRVPLNFLTNLLLLALLKLAFRRLRDYGEALDSLKLNFSIVMRSRLFRLLSRCLLAWQRRTKLSLRTRDMTRHLDKAVAQLRCRAAIYCFQRHARKFRIKHVLSRFCKTIEKMKYSLRFSVHALLVWTIDLETVFKKRLPEQTQDYLCQSFSRARLIPVTQRRQMLSWWRRQTTGNLKLVGLTQIVHHGQLEYSFALWRGQLLTLQKERLVFKTLQQLTSPGIVRKVFALWWHLTCVSIRGRWLAIAHRRLLLRYSLVRWTVALQLAKNERCIFDQVRPVLNLARKREALEAFRMNMLLSEWRVAIQPFIEKFQNLMLMRQSTERLKEWRLKAQRNGLRVSLIVLCRRRALFRTLSQWRIRLLSRFRKTECLLLDTMRRLQHKVLVGWKLAVAKSIRLSICNIIIARTYLADAFYRLRLTTPVVQYRPQQITSPRRQQKLYIQEAFLTAKRGDQLVLKAWNVLKSAWYHKQLEHMQQSKEARNLQHLDSALRRIQRQQRLRKAWLVWRWSHRLRISTRATAVVSVPDLRELETSTFSRGIVEHGSLASSVAAVSPATMPSFRRPETLALAALQCFQQANETSELSPTNSFAEFSQTVNEFARLRREMANLQQSKTNTENSMSAVADEGVVSTRVRHMAPHSCSPTFTRSAEPLSTMSDEPHEVGVPLSHEPISQPDVLPAVAESVLQRIAARHGLLDETTRMTLEFDETESRIVPTLGRVQSQQFLEDELRLFKIQSFVEQKMTSPPTFGD
eukprot:Gregarina_sp_Poly_1__7281@NODE_3_length_27868_cov_154_961188_g2_i0_p3_GENE_NODE_3_length_27868_cov_154_961188_g2_i0NODE_3_length_27868_cov_154_961188_g2_i0_p3_ORF_typecomplete_len807_score90_36MYO10_CC/PF16735_5/5_7e02MYO10_CC/PF16735_5/1_5Sfi1/PF08457_10/1_3e03Sfi1/PF08457_10/1_8e04_NODE_3_length_27868_cov_154_961188_g2_i01100013420